MKRAEQRDDNKKKSTPVDGSLDQLEQFFPEKKMEKAKARLAEAKAFLTKNEKQPQPAYNHS